MPCGTLVIIHLEQSHQLPGVLQNKQVFGEEAHEGMHRERNELTYWVKMEMKKKDIQLMHGF